MSEHVHSVVGRDDFTLPDGRRERWTMCGICRLQTKTTYQNNDPVKIRFNFAGVWFDPVELLRLQLPVILCETCKGDGIDTDNGADCPACHGLGVVTEAGEPVPKAPPPSKIRR